MRAALTACWLSTGSRRGQVGQVCWSFSGGSAWIREIALLISVNSYFSFLFSLKKMAKVRLLDLQCWCLRECHNIGNLIQKDSDGTHGAEKWIHTLL